ncbi:hypothetical protein NG796_22955 [Laspinema sp. A4]|uniref:hypothetical protein n=1 Tax=Laspinema sp. D2d TaxID=2953686 RepID=UPI0021BB9970|nr:hypothetical protein [Laspinema sp. D2d]MCT7986136.1 hypothetical protein [Laspinema sp. D2d]
MFDKIRSFRASHPVAIALAPMAIAAGVFQFNTPAAHANLSIVIDRGISIQVGQPRTVHYGYPGVYPGQYNPYYPPNYYPQYYPQTGQPTIRNSTLINPTVIDSRIENSTLINPVIIDSQNRNRLLVQPRTNRVRGVLPGSL